MDEPIIKKIPTEIFSYPFTDKSNQASQALREQYCRYISGTCTKPRKSEPHIKVGVCSLGYKGSFTNNYLPVIVCPHRFREDVVFASIRERYLSNWQGIEWVSEVSIGVGGNVDFVAVQRDGGGNITDFLCVEFQAAGTTGSPWQAILELKKHGSFLLDSYYYGINWANEFMKTMMQQVYKKGKIIDFWHHKIIFVIQDVALSYLRDAVDTSDLRPATADDPIHFCTYKLVWVENKWVLQFSEAVSTDLDGVNKILGGADSERYPTIDEFKSSIMRKGRSDGVF